MCFCLQKYINQVKIIIYLKIQILKINESFTIMTIPWKCIFKMCVFEGRGKETSAVFQFT